MNTRIPALSLAILGLVASTVSPCWSKGAHSPPIMLRDVRLIDGNGGPPLEHADILITGSKITAINAQVDRQPEGQNGNHNAGQRDAQPTQSAPGSAIKPPPNPTIINLTARRCSRASFPTTPTWA